jgi:hypothetical protein
MVRAADGRRPTLLQAERIVIKRLRSGGLITNYFCTSRCRHCLYNCSPDWPKEYISAETAETSFRTIQSLGCRAVHIGGGEPLLRPDALAEVLDAAARTGMRIDYVETNSSWYRDPDSAAELLNRLKQRGLHTLLVSISPFHGEYTPFAKVTGVMAAARQSGIRLFPWVDAFIPDLTALEHRQTHSLEEFEALYGSDYLLQVLGRYWIHLGGRALNTFRPVLVEKPLAQILEEGAGSCAAELLDTSHFHVDLFGNYIPGLCAGLAIRREDLGKPLNEGNYPLLSLLAGRGIGGFYRRARESHGFRPSRSAYLNKCDLCTEIRSHLVRRTAGGHTELRPLDFYAGVLDGAPDAKS